MQIRAFLKEKWLLPWLVAAAIVLALPARAQDKHASATGAGPAQIVPRVMLLPEEVVEEQWPAMPATVHPPKELSAIQPGQCVRFAVEASGEGRDRLLQQAGFTFNFSIYGDTQTFASAPPQIVKLTTPFMNEFLIDTLFKNRIPKELPKDGALAASSHDARWCATGDVRDGTATVSGTATLPDGKTIALKASKIEIKSFETARKKTPFKKIQEIDEWLMHYHDAPSPAFLLPALRLMANDPRGRDTPNGTEFFVAALKASPAAAEEIKRRLPIEDRWTKLIGTSALTWAGYATGSLRDSLDANDRALLDSVHLPDAFDMAPGPDIGARQDMLWAMFFATGRIEPVRAIASELSWSDDYAKLMEHGRQVRASGQKPSEEYPDYAGRGSGYAAAGWSMGSISIRDALLADYIEALKASPDTPAAVKKELANLYTNPAFKTDATAKQPQ